MGPFFSTTLNGQVAGKLALWNAEGIEMGLRMEQIGYINQNQLVRKSNAKINPLPNSAKRISRIEHREPVPFSGTVPGSVNLAALSIASGERSNSKERGLQFFTFDGQYVQKLQAGDPKTEEHFVGYFSELILLKLRSRLSTKEAIEDVRQETFVRVLAILRKDRGLQQPDRLGAFVNSVCNHVLLEHYRAKTRNGSDMESESGDTFVSKSPSALSLLETKDTERVVRQILAELNERDRRLLQSVMLEERDKDEVCAELGITREYLRVLLHRARESFKAFYISRLGESRLY